MDATHMEYIPEDCFDFVIDKGCCFITYYTCFYLLINNILFCVFSLYVIYLQLWTALMDAFMCNESNFRKLDEYFSEIHRVLKPTGCFLVISHGVPSTRLEHFPEDLWQVEPVPIRKCLVPNHYLLTHLLTCCIIRGNCVW